jgi:hypothetical protein
VLKIIIAAPSSTAVSVRNVAPKNKYSGKIIARGRVRREAVWK